MGFLDSNISLPLKSHPIRSKTDRHYQLYQRPRSRLSRFFLSQKLDYLQWIFTIVAFLSVFFLFQMFLPGSVVEKSEDVSISFQKDAKDSDLIRGLLGLKEIGVLDFGDDVGKFRPLRVLEKFKKEAPYGVDHSPFNNKTRIRFGYRKPKLALVFADLLAGPQQLLMVTVGAALQEIGYSIEVYAMSDGPANCVWKSIGVPVTVFEMDDVMRTSVDWLNFDGLLVNSLEAKGAISCFMQEPFKSVPLVWTIHEKSLAFRSRQYSSSGMIELLNDWKKVFSRANVVVFPNHFLPMIYSAFDAGNYYVIPGSPADAWEANAMMTDKSHVQHKIGYGPEDIVITIVGSQFSYKGLWLEHALILNALWPMFQDVPSDTNKLTSHLKIILLSGYETTNYGPAIEAIASNLSYPTNIVKHTALQDDGVSVLSGSDIVVYASFLEEQTFPELLLKAMCIGKPIVAPDLTMIRKFVGDRANGFLFPKENVGRLRQILQQLITEDGLSPMAHYIALKGRSTCKNLMVQETVEGYTLLLENVLKLPSEVTMPKSVTGIPPELKEEWRWPEFEAISRASYENTTSRSSKFLDEVEERWNHSQTKNSNSIPSTDQMFVYEIWEQEKNDEFLNAKRKREEEEMRDRTDQPLGTWEDVYKSAKRADRVKNDLHEREEGELERTGQPLCIYEPYLGEGTWHFLHRSALYRGIGLSTKGRRPRNDDIDAPSQLPLLKDPYYRDVLGEHGALFALASRIDHVHKNAWIGLQSWRATARKKSLSRIAEKALLDAIESQKHGDAFYFWVRMDKNPRFLPGQDFWAFCDAINAGNCRAAFSEAFKWMYGVKHEAEFLPPMPKDGEGWSVMHSWVLPTRSFLEYVMFSRMFVDALDAQMYDEHHRTGQCSLSFYKDKHCYSRVLEVLINIWAYHSARRMIYINPESGLMQQQHKFKSRRGKMWVKWFSNTTLKSMDEDLAEKADCDPSKQRWLWPLTGEVVWPGLVEKERALLVQQKKKKKQENKEKRERMRKKQRQKAIGKYVKPPPDDRQILNSTLTSF